MTVRRELGVWSAAMFPDSISVPAGGRTIYLSGMGAEDVDDGHIRHPGDFAAQCRHSWEKVKAALARQDAAISDVVKVTTYVLDAEHRAVNTECRKEAFDGAPLPVHTLIVVAGLAWPQMLVEIDVVAVVTT
jgi:2-iminobutanoate/2-iminopropanoate deaminase